MRNARVAAVFAAMLIVGGAGGTRAAQIPQAQQGGVQQGPPAFPGQTGGPPPFGTAHDPAEDDPGRQRMMQEAIQHENDARHKKMSEDAAQLVALSTELKAEVDKTGKDQLSLDVIRKADAIEKLAHAVKERMRQ